MREWKSLLQASSEAGSTNELKFVVGMLERTAVTVHPLFSLANTTAFVSSVRICEGAGCDGFAPRAAASLLRVVVLHGHTNRVGYGDSSGKGHPAWFSLAQLQSAM